jgi:hypothetical protein
MNNLLNDGATLWSDMLADPDELFMNGASDFESDATFQHNEEDYDNEPHL